MRNMDGSFTRSTLGEEGGVVLKALKKSWERWEMKTLGGEGGLWERLRDEDEDGGCVKMKMKKHGWRLGFTKYLAESKVERREECGTTFSIYTSLAWGPFFWTGPVWSG